MELNLGEIMSNNVELCRYEKPTPIQKYAIPTVLAGRDVMGCAQTGQTSMADFLLLFLCYFRISLTLLDF